MKERRVVAYKNLPQRPPIWTSVTAWLVLDRLQSPGWVWGMVGTVFAILWIVCIIDLFSQKSVELRELSESEPGNP